MTQPRRPRRTPIPAQPPYTVTEFARKHSVSLSLVWKWIRAGVIEIERHGGSRLHTHVVLILNEDRPLKIGRWPKVEKVDGNHE